MVLKYAARDWATILQALLDEIKTDPAKSAVWTDYEAGGVGIVLLELLSHLGDMLEHSLDYRSSELYLTTARLKESVLRIAKSTGYRLRGPNAALCVVSLDFTSAGAPWGVALTLPAMAVTVGAVPWYYAGGDVLAAGQSTKSLTFIQAASNSLSASGTGESYQQLSLGTAKVPFSSIAVEVDAVAWSETSPIALSSYNERSFEIQFDESENTLIQWGNGFAGRKPPDGSTIETTFLVTVGAEGNVGAGVFDGETLTFFASELSANVTVDLSNALAAAGGLDAADWQDVKNALVPWRRSIDVGVTEEAIKALTLAFSDPLLGSVTKCTPVVVQANTYANNVGIYVAVSAGTYTLMAASTALKTALLTYLNLRKIITVQYSILDPTFVPTNVAVNVRTVLGASATEVQTAVDAAIKTLFNVDAIEIGTPVYLSDMYRVVEAVEDVDWCIFTTPTDNVTVDASAGEVVQLGTITVSIV
jgi:hypothetical protein